MKRTCNNSLNSTFINTLENLNGTRNLTKQNIQTPSHFVNEQIVKTLPITTKRSISPSHPTLTTPHKENNIFFPPTTLQSTVTSSVVPKNSYVNYQLNGPITKKRPPNKQINSIGNNFANHNYDFSAENNSCNPIAKPFYSTQDQSQEHNYTQQARKHYLNR